MLLGLSTCIKIWDTKASKSRLRSIAFPAGLCVRHHLDTKGVRRKRRVDPVNSVGEVFNPPTKLSWTVSKISWIQHKSTLTKPTFVLPFRLVALKLIVSLKEKKRMKAKGEKTLSWWFDSDSSVSQGQSRWRVSPISLCPRGYVFSDSELERVLF